MITHSFRSAGRRYGKTLVAALALGLIAALGASARPMMSAEPSGRQAPLDQNIIQFFTSNGVDAKYLSAPQASVPADVWQKIVTLDKDPALQALVLSDLRADRATFGNTLYMQIGNTVFRYSRNPGAARTFDEATVS